jgi:asparagine synthase (glutamine-hydrolysing)
MCGFAGILNSRKNINNDQLRKYAANVAFRGPDSCGVRIMNDQLQPVTDGTHALFFNRLAIVDLDHRSDQPFEDERYLLTFNGEIYNYTELKAELGKKNIQFRTTSDTEVLFYCLREWGEKALLKLNGMFSFFWLDKKERKFIVARDRLGIKPLYYSIRDNSFCFGSELHSILRLSRHRPEIDQESVKMYLWMQFVPTPFTIVKGISKLPPGHFIAGNIDRISERLLPQEYWDAYDQLNTDEVETGSLELLLKDSLDRQLHADVPLGLFLSSGVDSSLLAALVNKYHAKDEDVNFFTVSFQEKTAANESADALDFIKGFRNPHLKTHLLQVHPDFIRDQLTDFYKYVDEPFGDSATLLNWAISKKAREHVTVALSGDGADELFWGYPRYNKWEDITKYNTYPVLSKMISASSSMVPVFSVRNKFQRIFGNDAVDRHFDAFLMPGFRSVLREPITNRKMWATDGIERIKGRKDLPAVLDIKTYLADAMLYKVDRASMAASLEVRVPYLDNKIVDYALNLDFGEKSNDRFRNKAILKNLLLNLAPHYNVHRAKKGFNFPRKKWLREQWKELVMQTVKPEALASLGLDPKPFLSLVKDFYDDKRKQDVEVWYLFSLTLWKQQFDRMAGQLS